MVKKHTKPTKEKKGGIVSIEKSIHLSNLSVVDADKKVTKGKKEESKKTSSKPNLSGSKTKKIKKDPMKKDTKKITKPTKKKTK
jgi:large subunit ribosomal protein L24